MMTKIQPYYLLNTDKIKGNKVRSLRGLCFATKQIYYF